MIPTRLRLRNVASFTDLEMDIPPGCLSLVGPNGAGKSTLMQSIEIALFGQRSMDPLVRVGESTLELELEFQHRDWTYRVRRGRQRGKPTLEFDVYDADHWEPLTQGNAKDTQAVIDRTIGLTRATWRASAYLAQGDTGAFTEADRVDRKKILADALALNEWERLATLVATDRRQLARDAEQAAGRSEALAEQVERAEDHKARHLQLIADQADARVRMSVAAGANLTAQRTLEGAQQTIAQRDQLEAEYGRASAEYNAARDRMDDAEKALAVIATERERIGTMRTFAAEAEQLSRLLADAAVLEQQHRDAVQQRKTHLAEAGRLVVARARLVDRAAEIAKKIAALGQPAATCDRCGQELPDHAREVAADSLAAEARAVEAEAQDLDARRRGAETAAYGITIPDVPDTSTMKQRHLELVDAGVDLARAEERIGHLEQRIAYITDDRKTELAALAAESVAARDRVVALGDPVGIGPLRKTAHDAAGALEDQQRNLNDIDRAVAAVEALIASAAKVTDDLRELEQRRGEMTRKLMEMEKLERAFGRNGVPAWIVEQHAIPAIEAEANRILTILGGPVSHVELRTTRELKSGELSSDELNIVCVTVDGARDYSTFSGGEKTRISIALRLAFARLLAQRRDADIRLLCLDEPEGLDVAGTEALAGVLRELVQDGIVDTTILASHDPGLRDRFDMALVVTNTEAGSQLEIQ